jgi:hypothetical protein
MAGKECCDILEGCTQWQALHAADLVHVTESLKRARTMRTRHNWSPFSAAADRRASTLQVIESAVSARWDITQRSRSFPYVNIAVPFC